MLGLAQSAKAMLSISMIALAVLAVFQWKGKRPIFRENLKRNWSAFWKSPPYWCLTLFFLIVFWTLPYSTDSSEYMFNRLLVKLPFLLLPFAFFSIPKLSRKTIHFLFYILLLFLCISSVQLLVEYAYNVEAAIEAIGQGAAITSEVNHIRHSLLIATGIALIAFLLDKGIVLKYKWEPYLLMGVCGFLIAFLHVLAARSGLVIFYLLILYVILKYIYRTGKFFNGMAIVLCLMALPVLAYQGLPSFKKKIDYVLWDFKQSQLGKRVGFSDGQRWVSWRAGLSIIKENPVLGVGAGDLKKEVWSYYQRVIPTLAEPLYKMPHNQFISVWAGSGLLGLFVFLWAFLVGLKEKKLRQFEPYLLFKGMILLSFLVENTIENAVGIAFYLFFELLFLKYLEAE